MKRILERVAVPLIAAIIGAAIVGGVAIASIPDANGTIHGCYTNTTGALRVIDSSTQTCASGQTALNWNQQGPRGPSNAYAVYHDTKTSLATTGTILDSEKVGAGSYVIIAKTTVNRGATFDYNGYCRLSAGGDIDTQVFNAAAVSPGAAIPLTLTVVHTATAQTSVNLACYALGTASYSKLIAVKVGSLTNSAQ